jgi:YVTN family beta-propeller protein
MKKMMFFVFFAAFFISNAQTPVSHYRIVKKIHLEGDGGWDYLVADDSSARLYVSHGTMVQVADMKKGEWIATIPDTKGVHGIALAPGLNRGYISCGRDSTITVFDLKTFSIIGKIKGSGRNPDAILFEPLNKRVFTFNGGSADATVIDAASGKVIETIKLAGKPEFSVTDGKGTIFVNIEDKSLIQVINGTTLKVERQWSLAPGEEPSGLALDRKNNRLFSVCGNKLMVISDAVAGKVVDSVPIGERVDGVAYDPGEKKAYSSNGEGTMTVVSEVTLDKFVVMENFPTQPGARTISVDKKTHHIYLPAAEFESAPVATPENPRPRPKVKPNTFVVLEIEPVK